VPDRRVLIIGAGIVGASVALRLADSGAEVIVLEGGVPGSGTTAASISWLSSFPQLASAPPEDRILRDRLEREFHQLEEEVGPGACHWTGTLTWAGGEAGTEERLAADYRLARERGADVAVLAGAEAQQLEPAIRVYPDARVYWERGGGWVDAPALVAKILATAERRGARVMAGSPVEAIERQDGRVTAVVTRNGQRLPGDVIVNAAGSWAAHVAALAGCTLPLDLRPGLLVHSEDLGGGQPRHVLNGPAFYVRPDPGGGIAVHWRGEDLYLAEQHRLNGPGAQEVLDDVATWLPALKGARPKAVKVGIRPVPPGGPVVGWHPQAKGFYVVVSHGGVGWAPTWGRLVTQEVTTGRPGAELARWRPDRFIRLPVIRGANSGGETN
jgi:glycine/D-amino acid oxidase-like deaminating enzyme